MNWHTYFHKIAQVVSEKSKDDSIHIGAVIVGPDREIVSTGYNSYPRGIDDGRPERQERPEKYFWFEHAERNAIYNAARIGVSTKGCTMYLTCSMTCSGCARGIINAGIVRVFVTRVNEFKGAHWDEDFRRSEQMLKEAGVVVEYYPDDPTPETETPHA